MKFKKESGTSWGQMLKEGRAMRKIHDLSWGQVIMAGNTPVFLWSREGPTSVSWPAAKSSAFIRDILPVAALTRCLIGEAAETLVNLEG